MEEVKKYQKQFKEEKLEEGSQTYKHFENAMKELYTAFNKLETLYNLIEKDGNDFALREYNKALRILNVSIDKFDDTMERVLK